MGDLSGDIFSGSSSDEELMQSFRSARSRVDSNKSNHYEGGGFIISPTADLSQELSSPSLSPNHLDNDDHDNITTGLNEIIPETPPSSEGSKSGITLKTLDISPDSGSGSGSSSPTGDKSTLPLTDEESIHVDNDSNADIISPPEEANSPHPPEIDSGNLEVQVRKAFRTITIDSSPESESVMQIMGETYTTTPKTSSSKSTDPNCRPHHTVIGAMEQPRIALTSSNQHDDAEGNFSNQILGINNPRKFVASTPLLSNNRKKMDANLFANLDITGIVDASDRHVQDRDTRYSIHELSSDEQEEEEEDKTHPVNLDINYDSDDIKAVSNSEDDSRGSGLEVSSFEDEQAFGACALPPPKSKIIRHKKNNKDLEALTEKFRNQQIDRKPLVQLLENPPNPFNPSQKQNQNQNLIALPAAGGEEWKDDVAKVVSQLVIAIESMPSPNDKSDFKPPRKLRVELFPHQIHGVQWMLWREQHFPGGGILADEMGLGKTVMALALILNGNERDPDEESENWLTPRSRKLIPTTATLVVCPVGCIGQWENEIKSKAKGLKVSIYHGPNKTKSAAILAQSDVVITSYPTITSEIPKPDDDPYNRCVSPLIRLHWERVMLDEGHVIRNPKTGGAQGVCRLTAKHRWIITGTPIHNKPEDFFSLAKFLQLSPFDDTNCWKFWIGMKKVPGRNMERLQMIGKALILRRSKVEVQLDGCEMASIPPKTVEDVELEMLPEEKTVYTHLENYARQQFKHFLEAREERTEAMQRAADTFEAKRKGGRGKQKENSPEEVKFSHMLALITRLRQASVLPFLMSTMLEEEEEGDQEDTYDALNDPVNLKNPVFEIHHKSSKIRAVLREIKKLRDKAVEEGVPMDKVIIVSQWTSLLNILIHHLKGLKLSVVEINGTQNVAERTATMIKFNANPKAPNILLLSIAAGGVGLNLVGANHVYFMEPHWNPQMERQAQDRVHRFGQRKPVFIKRFFVKDTIEQRVLQLQEEKINLADGLLDGAKNTRGVGLNLDNMRKLFDL